MLLPFREHLDFGPTPYDLLQQKEGIPIVKGNVVKDVTTLELGHWRRMGVPGCYINLSNQQRTSFSRCPPQMALRITDVGILLPLAPQAAAVRFSPV